MTGREQALGDAPSLAECVSHYTAPGPGGGHAVQPPEMEAVRKAVAHWLDTWRGLKMSAEDLVDRV